MTYFEVYGWKNIKVPQESPQFLLRIFPKLVSIHSSKRYFFDLFNFLDFPSSDLHLRVFSHVHE